MMLAMEETSELTPDWRLLRGEMLKQMSEGKAGFSESQRELS